MVNRLCAILGLGLLAFWIVGLGDSAAHPWINWLTGLLALASFSIAAFLPKFASRRICTLLPGLMSLSLAFLWIASVALGTVGWQRITNALFAIVFGMVSLKVGLERRAPIAESEIHLEGLEPHWEEEEKYRKSA